MLAYKNTSKKRRSTAFSNRWLKFEPTSLTGNLLCLYTWPASFSFHVLFLGWCFNTFAKRERKKSLCIATPTATVQNSWQGPSSWSQTTARKRKPSRLAGSEWMKEESQWRWHVGDHMELESVLKCRFYKNFWVKLCLLLCFIPIFYLQKWRREVMKKGSHWQQTRAR